MSSTHILHKSDYALLLIDVISHFEFDDGANLLTNALKIAPRLAQLKERARRADIPVLYVNDNFGQWRSEASKLLQYCLRPEAGGREFVDALKPDENDYFVLKPMHSAFYQSPLEVLLRKLGTSSLILGGIATNSCVVCTAQDAAMRDFRLFVPSDCSAAASLREHKQAIEQIRSMTGANVRPARSLRFRKSR